MVLYTWCHEIVSCYFVMIAKSYGYYVGHTVHVDFYMHAQCM